LVIVRLKLSSLLGYLVPCLAVSCVLVAASPARAADSLAPSGAPRDWLPHEDWVLEHWLPYDQNTLLRILGLNLEQVRRYFQSDPGAPVVPTLAALARSRGIGVQRLANELVASWHPRVSRGQYAVLLDRAMRTLTQGHLMQHMLFHPFHDTALFRASPQVFGVSPHDLNQYRAQRISHAEIGYQHGRTYQQMAATAIGVLRGEEAVGVRGHLTPPSEAQAELADQIATLPKWLSNSSNNPQTIFAPGASQPTPSNRAARPAGDATVLGTANIFAALKTSSCCCCCCCCGSGGNDSSCSEMSM
jgi:hypothetical protein